MFLQQFHSRILDEALENFIHKKKTFLAPLLPYLLLLKHIIIGTKCTSFLNLAGFLFFSFNFALLNFGIHSIHMYM